LYTRLKYHAPSKPEIFKWEKEIETIEKNGNTFSEKGENNILFIGSSYIRLWGETMAEDLSPIKTINHGFGGSKLSDVAYYIDRLVANQQNVNAVYLYVGNDIVGAESDKTPLQVLELVKYITLKIRKQFPEATIYWSEISPCEKRWKVWNQVQEANKLIKNFCVNENNLKFVETSSFYLSEKNYPLTQYYREDHLHYNKEGYKVWGSIIKKQILKQ
jgi:lysophospholipase L1-like esterase